MNSNRTTMLRVIVVVLVSVIAAGCGSGADTLPENAGTIDDVSTTAVDAGTEGVEDEDVAAFFARFKSTVRANDAEAVANMAQFPFEMGGMTRDEFLTDNYASTLGEGDFRNRLLAGSPAALTDEGDGRYSFSALVTEDCGDLAEEFDCESAVVFYFGQNTEGHWRLVDMMFAG